MEDISKYYEILGLKIGATFPQVKEAYKDLVKVWHPDRFVNDPDLQEKAHRKISEINTAFSKIKEFLTHLDAYQQATGAQQQTATDSPPRPREPQDAKNSSSPKTSDDESGPSRERPFARPPGTDSPRPQSNNKQRHLYEAVLGERNGAYYIAKFEQFDSQGERLKASWNWPAFLIGGGWALYRKMYGWFFASWGIATLSGMIEKSGFAGVGAVIYFVFAIPFAIYANSLYHKRVKLKIATAQLSASKESELIEWLRSRGGVNIWVKWVGIALPVVGIAVIAIPNYFASRKSNQVDTSKQSQPAPFAILNDDPSRNNRSIPEALKHAPYVKPYVADVPATPIVDPSRGPVPDIIDSDPIVQEILRRWRSGEVDEDSARRAMTKYLTETYGEKR